MLTVVLLRSSHLTNQERDEILLPCVVKDPQNIPTNKSLLFISLIQISWIPRNVVYRCTWANCKFGV